MTVKILIGDVRDKLREMPDESVHCVVTSPPYWGLRCYGVDGQIGQEPTLGEHVEVMVEVFREVRRVLRKDGTVWLNYGDCYAAAPHGSVEPVRPIYPPSGSDPFRRDTGRRGGGRNTDTMLKPKDLCMMPARVALALQADGWWIRSEIIWHKPNPMPESCTDRPTSSHEKIYLLAKSARYYFDAEAVREAHLMSSLSAEKDAAGAIYEVRDHGRFAQKLYPPAGRNIRNVWTIATAPFPQAHFATFPPALVEPCIKAGTSEKGCCPECGAPWVRETEQSVSFQSGSGRAGNKPKGKHDGKEQSESGNYVIRMGPVKKVETTGWSPSCNCFCNFAKPCTVLDPFAGAGTVGLVADRLGRDATLIELNPDYAAMSRERIQADAGMFGSVLAPAVGPG